MSKISSDNSSDHIRLAKLFDLVARQDQQLQAVRSRLLSSCIQPDSKWLVAILATDTGIDQLESFNAKFSRMQDTVIDKLLPLLLKAAGETPLAAIDNLNRAERLGFISDTNAWLEMRRLRNLLVHEYIESPDDMLPALKKACSFTEELHTALLAMAEYGRDHLGLQLDSNR